MGAFLIGNKKVVLPEYRDEYKNRYWSILTKHVEKKIGLLEVTNPDEVTNILKECFSLLCSEFEKAISEVKEASFFLFCNDVHENSIDLWKKQSEGHSLGIDEEQFAASRRILKIILEQGCKLELKGHSNFVKEVQSKEKNYIEHLEKLLYIGAWCIAFSEDVSNSQLFPMSKGIQIKKGDLTILTYQPYPELFKFVHEDLQRHNSNVQLSNSLIDFKVLLKNELNVDYDILTSFINQKHHHANYNYSITKINPLIQGLHEELGYSKEFLMNFYGGLTISYKNVLSIEECILKNQDSRRFIFRPILQYSIDNDIYNVVGYNKWLESISILSINSFPFGQYPEEWKIHDPVKKFVQKITDEHDSILEAPIVDFLKSKNIKVDGNIKSFKTKQGNNIPIEYKGLGEIDLIFIHEQHKIIYVGECKHNRSRFDMNNWKRDYSNFVNKYESQLSNKEKWINENLSIVKEHFEVKYNCSLDFEGYIVKAAFFINAPTVYMHNGKYRAFTITDLKNIVDDKVIDIIFRFTHEDTGVTFDIGHPYFDNLKAALSNQ